MLRKLRKGITLIELVVSISVSTIIFAGITGLLIFLNNSNNSLKADAKTFYNANSLSHAIESVLDIGNSSLFNLPTSTKVFEDDYQKEVSGVDASVPILFTVIKADNTKNYYFYKQHFGYTEGTSLLFKDIYVSETKVKLEFKPQSADLYMLTLNYGESYSGHFNVVKTLYKGA